MYGSSSLSTSRRSSASAAPAASFVLPIFRTSFTHSFFFATVAIARRHRVRCIPEDDPSLGNVGLSFPVVQRGDGAVSMKSCSPTNDLNSVIRDRFDVRVGMAVIIVTAVFQPPILETGSSAHQYTFERATPDASPKLPPSPPIAFWYLFSRTREIACCSSKTVWSTLSRS